MIDAPNVVNDLKKGSSISVDGTCLTCTQVSDEGFSAEIMPETIAKTTLGLRNQGDKLNLELAMPANGRFEGHIVSGHIDGVGEIINIQEDGNSHILTIHIKEDLMKYIVTKGSITINGISLTIIDAKENNFSVGIIPHTWDITNLQFFSISDKVNVETDLIAKYIERLSP